MVDTRMFRHGGARCRITHEDGALYLDKVWCREEDRGQGHASTVLKMALDYADERSQAVSLFVWAVGEPGLDRTQAHDRLRKWYARHGFYPTDEGTMVRPPRASFKSTYPCLTR